MNDLVKILLRYHAYNAANLDGGNSSVMVVMIRLLIIRLTGLIEKKLDL